MKSFKDKVAAITGAASGIGRALAVELARRGCHLSLSDVNDVGLAETAQTARTQSAAVKVTTTHLDVSDRAAMFAWAEQTAGDHGRVNLIFNNAGVALSALLSDIKQSDFEWIVGINFWGVVYGTQAFLPHLVRSGEGHVINLSSLFGIMSVPSQGAYNSTKFAVRGYTEALRMELDFEANGVSATCVHPGGIATNISNSSRIDQRIVELSGVDAATLRARANKALQTTSPASAALQILRAVELDRRRVVVGPDAKFLDILVRLLGSWYQPLVTWSYRRQRSR